ncbi:MAG: VWA domain-containing protein [Planctomycetales bacterium]|nr:VWA domain-containing protein [Planctomycetales bacterium]
MRGRFALAAGAVLLTGAAAALSIAQAPGERRVVFVLDASLSMLVRDRAGGPTRFATALAEVEGTLEGYAGDLRARIVAFGVAGPEDRDIVEWPEEPGFAGRERFVDARKWLARLSEKGGPRGVSRIGAALAAAFAHAPGEVVLYTDGVPVEPPRPGGLREPRDPASEIAGWRDETRDAARRANAGGSARLLIVGVGARLEETREFLRALAADHGGIALVTG